MRDDELPIDPDLDFCDAAPRGAAEPGPPGIGRTPPPGIDVLLAVAAGGVLGTLARATLGSAFPAGSGRVPLTTLSINVFGAFALGLLMVVLVDIIGPAPRLKPFLTTGILGGFTTFSTFMVETDRLVHSGHAAAAIVYVAASITLGIGAAFAGIGCGHVLAARAATRTPRGNGGRTR
ncbi:MAG: CrcB family protein [Actinobacteria bacterium]|nr:CrcB family protein [Actinomycetota bacterium]